MEHSFSLTYQQTAYSPTGDPMQPQAFMVMLKGLS